MDGPWQLGHKSAEDYSILASDVARGMRQMDANVELVVCGSSAKSMPTFGRWDETVLENSYDLVDHISLHRYYEDYGNTQEFLLSSTDLDHFIDEICNIADAVKAKRQSNKTITLSLDEWNVWKISAFKDLERAKTWELAPRVIEDEYNVADAVVVGNLLISILRRSDRVKIACLAQLVNVIAPIRAEVGHPAWRQTTFFPFAYTARYGKGKALITRVDSPKITTEKYGTVSALDAICTYDETSNSAALFVVNRSLEESYTTEIDLRGFSDVSVIEQVTITDTNLKRSNNLEVGEAVQPIKDVTAVVINGKIQVTLTPASWQMVRISLQQIA